MEVSSKPSLLCCVHSFYAIIANEAAGYPPSRTDELFINNLAVTVRDYLWIAALGEARYSRTFCKTYLFGTPAATKGSYYRQEVYNYSPYFAPDRDNIKTLKAIFRQKWNISNYGGKAWLQIVRHVEKFNSKKVNYKLWLDVAFHLHHNSGTVFNKPAIFSDTPDCCDKVMNFLNFRQSYSIREYQRCICLYLSVKLSPELRNPKGVYYNYYWIWRPIKYCYGKLQIVLTGDHADEKEKTFEGLKYNPNSFPKKVKSSDEFISEEVVENVDLSEKIIDEVIQEFIANKDQKNTSEGVERHE